MPFLIKLPPLPLAEYQEVYVKVRNRSTVPSRVIGAKLKAKIHDDKIELYVGKKVVCTLPRIYEEKVVHINYRHIIDSLLKKPAAFEGYKYREELYPTKTFKKAFDYLTDIEVNKNSQATLRQRTIEYLRILKLAAYNSERDVECAIDLILDDPNINLNIDTISNLILLEGSKKVCIDSIMLIPNLNIYDDLFLTKG